MRYNNLYFSSFVPWQFCQSDGSLTNFTSILLVFWLSIPKALSSIPADQFYEFSFTKFEVAWFLLSSILSLEKRNDVEYALKNFFWDHMEKAGNKKPSFRSICLHSFVYETILDLEEIFTICSEAGKNLHLAFVVMILNLDKIWVLRCFFCDCFIIGTDSSLSAFTPAILSMNIRASFITVPLLSEYHEKVINNDIQDTHTFEDIVLVLISDEMIQKTVIEYFHTFIAPALEFLEQFLESNRTSV